MLNIEIYDMKVDLPRMCVFSCLYDLCTGHLEFDHMTLIYELDLNILKIFPVRQRMLDAFESKHKEDEYTDRQTRPNALYTGCIRGRQQYAGFDGED